MSIWIDHKDDQDKSELVGVMKSFLKNIILILVYSLFVLCELFVNARTWIKSSL